MSISTHTYMGVVSMSDDLEYNEQEARDKRCEELEKSLAAHRSEYPGNVVPIGSGRQAPKPLDPSTLDTSVNRNVFLIWDAAIQNPFSDGAKEFIDKVFELVDKRNGTDTMKDYRAIIENEKLTADQKFGTYMFLRGGAVFMGQHTMTTCFKKARLAHDRTKG